jgi:vacuolar-type H+-ATPase subunit I/STV1
MDFNAIAIVIVNLVAIAIFASVVFSKSGIAYKQRTQLDHYLTQLENMVSGLEAIQSETQAKIDQKIEEKFAESISVLKTAIDLEKNVRKVADKLEVHQDKFRLLEKELISLRVLPMK